MGIVEKLLEKLFTKIESIDSGLDTLCEHVDAMPYIGLLAFFCSALFLVLISLTDSGRMKWKGGKVGGKRITRISLLFGLATCICFNIYSAQILKSGAENTLPILDSIESIDAIASDLNITIDGETYEAGYIVHEAMNDKLEESRLVCGILPTERISMQNNGLMTFLGIYIMTPSYGYAILSTIIENEDEEIEVSFKTFFYLLLAILALFVLWTPPTLMGAGVFMLVAWIFNWALHPDSDDPPDQKGKKESSSSSNGGEASNKVSQPVQSAAGESIDAEVVEPAPESPSVDERPYLPPPIPVRDPWDESREKGKMKSSKAHAKPSNSVDVIRNLDPLPSPPVNGETKKCLTCGASIPMLTECKLCKEALRIL